MSLQEFVNRVRATATKAGGGYVPYSQCLEPTATLIKMLPSTQGGICMMLCAKWIAEHAHDRSLWNWLCTPGTMNVRQSMIGNLMVNFTESVSSNPNSRTHNSTIRMTQSESTQKFAFQVTATDRYLRQFGVIRRGTARGRMSAQHSYSDGNAMGERMSRDLDPDRWNGQNFYIMIIISGEKGAHALCAFVGRNDVAFFDPNFGEFYFDSRVKYKEFMRDFWRTSGYRNSYTAYRMLDYGRSMNS
jgi:YopT-type cysteine protease-like protein